MGLWLCCWCECQINTDSAFIILEWGFWKILARLISRHVNLLSVLCYWASEFHSPLSCISSTWSRRGNKLGDGCSLDKVSRRRGSLVLLHACLLLCFSIRKNASTLVGHWWGAFIHRKWRLPLPLCGGQTDGKCSCCSFFTAEAAFKLTS